LANEQIPLRGAAHVTIHCPGCAKTLGAYTRLDPPHPKNARTYFGTLVCTEAKCGVIMTITINAQRPTGEPDLEAGETGGVEAGK